MLDTVAAVVVDEDPKQIEFQKKFFPSRIASIRYSDQDNRNQ